MLAKNTYGFKHIAYPNLQLWIYAFSIVSHIIVSNFLPLSFKLKNLNNLIISQATAYGISVDQRVRTVYMLIIIGGISVLMIYFLLRQLSIKKIIKFDNHPELLLFAVSILCLSYLQVIGIKSIRMLELTGSIFLLRCVMLAIAAANKRLGAVLKNGQVFAYSIMYAFFLLTAILLLFGNNEWIQDNTVWVFNLLWIICTVMYSVYIIKKKWSILDITFMLLPMLAIPLCAFVTIEMYLNLMQVTGFIMPFKKIFIIFLVMIVALYKLLFRNIIHSKFSLKSITENFIAPSLIFCFVLTAYYMPLYKQNREMFEMANSANSILRVFKFGEIPFLDFTSSHMLSEQWFGYLYCSIFGFNGFPDFYVYSFLNDLIYLIILYYFLNRLFRNAAISLFFVITFPLISSVIYPLTSIVLLPLFVLYQIIEKPSARNFLKLLFIVFFIMIWKIDCGVAVLFTTVIFYIAILFLTRKSFPVEQIAKSLMAFSIFLIAFFCVCIALRGYGVVMNDMKMALHYFTGNQAHGYKEILSGIEYQFYVQYVLLPVVSIACCYYIFITLRQSYSSMPLHKRIVLLASLYFFILFICNIQRGMVRHGFAERNDMLPLSFLPGLALLIVYWIRGNSFFKISVLYLTVFFGIVILKKFWINTDEITLEKTLQQSSISTINSIKLYKGQSRTIEDTAFANKAYKDLKVFLDKNLTANQTFLDFSSLPMLYFYTGRREPGYFNQNLQNTIDNYLDIELIKRANIDSTPITIWASCPRSGMDISDEIANEDRNFLLAEHILQYYKPYGVINDKSIFATPNLSLPDNKNFEKDTVLTKPDTVNIFSIPEYTGAYYNQSKKRNELKIVKVFNCDSNNLYISIPIDSSIRKLNHCYLSVEYEENKNMEPYQVYVRFLDQQYYTTVKGFLFTRSDKVSSRYLIRLSNHYFWHDDKNLELFIADNNHIKRIAILKDIRFED